MYLSALVEMSRRLVDNTFMCYNGHYCEFRTEYVYLIFDNHIE